MTNVIIGSQQHLQYNVPFTIVVVCHSDILMAPDESEVMLHLPGFETCHIINMH